MPQIIESPPTFTSNVDQILSSTDVNVLRANAIALDGLSYRQVPGFDSSATWETGTPGRYPGSSAFRIWWGTLRYRSGMTTCTVELNFTRAASEVIRIYFDGVLKDTVSTGGSHSRNISISTGYTDGQFIDIQIKVESNTLKTGSYVIMDVYGSPVTMSTSWPGVPSFSDDVYTAAKLDQLVDACEWLYDRIDAVPMVPGQYHMYANGTHKVEAHTLWYGSITRYYTADQLYIGVIATVNNDAEQVLVYINGVLAYSGPSWGLSTTNALEIKIGFSGYAAVGDRVQVAIVSNVTNASTNASRVKKLNSRYRMAIMSRATANYPIASPPSFTAANLSISASTLSGILNGIATILSDTKTRIDNNSQLWNRIRAMRRRYGYDENNNVKLTPTYMPWFIRKGDRLVIRGKNIGIGWGGNTIESASLPVTGGSVESKDGVIEYEKLTFNRTEQAIGGDRLETVEIFLDSLEALYPGTPYFITGTELVWCAEFYQ